MPNKLAGTPRAQQRTNRWSASLWLVACLLMAPVAAWAQALPPVITTIAGGGSPQSGNGDGGPATEASILAPMGVAVDLAGNVYVAESGFRVRKIAPSGAIGTVAGNGSQAFNGDGIPATSAGIDVRGIAVDGAGNLYIADGSNRRVRMVSTAGTISTIASTGLQFPTRLAVDGAGVVHVLDGIRVLRIGAGGSLQAVAGNGTYGLAGDGGPAALAQLVNPTAISFDRQGRLYIVTGERVRRVDAGGIISTVVGGGPFRIDPVATSYRWSFPTGVAVDSRGSIFVSGENNVVRIVSRDGIAGDAAGHLVDAFGIIIGAPFGYSGDGGPATAALLYEPQAVAIDQHDNLYIADTRNHRIRKVTPVQAPRTPLGVSAFAPFKTYPVGSYGTSIAVADVTGDGRDDALMLTFNWDRDYLEPANDNRINLFVQNADGTLAAPRKYSHNQDGTLPSTTTIATGDLDNDGRADVVVGMRDGIRIYKGHAEGLDQGMPIAGVPHAQVTHSAVVVDINGDGNLDVVTLSGGREEGGSYPDDLYGFLYFYGNGAGGISSKQFVPLDDGRAWGQLEVHDLDGDGRLDLTGRWSDVYQDAEGMWRYRHGVAWKLHHPGAGFAPARSASITGWNSSHPYAVGDFNGDGRKDLLMAATANTPQAYYVLLVQDADGNFSEARRWSAFDVPQVLLGADMNGDGLADLLVAHGGWHAIGFHPGTGIGLDDEIKYYIDESANQTSQALASGDLNGDGCKDVAMGDRNFGLVVMTGIRCFTSREGSQPLLPPRADAARASAPISMAAAAANAENLPGMGAAGSRSWPRFWLFAGSLLLLGSAVGGLFLRR